MRVTDKIISLEAAKLLGLPFTWACGVYACKFVHTDEGPRVMRRRFPDERRPALEDQWQRSWTAPEELAASLHENRFELYLVEDDEATDALHR